MQQSKTSNGETVDKLTDTSEQKRIQRLDKAVAYYGSIRHVVTIIIGIVFGIVELRYGLQYIGQCPIQPMIAYFLTVHGSVMLFEVLIGILAFLVSRVIYKKYNQVAARKLIFVLILIIVVVNLFCFAWFIAGNVWVFGAARNGYQNTDNTNPTTYCEADLFRTALGIIISRYVSFVIIVIVVLISKRQKIMSCCKKKEVPPVNGASTV